MPYQWKQLGPHFVRIGKRVFFFYKSSYSASSPSDPIRWKIPYRHPLARALVGCLPFLLKKPFLRLYVTERIVEYPFVLRSLDLPLGSTVLDLGAAGSPLVLQLASLGYKVLAVDLLEYSLTHPNLEFRRWNILTESLPPESVDAVIAVSTIEHIGIPYYGGRSAPEGDMEAAQKIWNLLKPQGLLLLTTPYGEPAQTSLQRVYDQAGLGKLLERFEIEKIEFFRREEGCHWIRTDQATMRNVSSAYQTEGVALVRARKQSGSAIA